MDDHSRVIDWTGFTVRDSLVLSIEQTLMINLGYPLPPHDHLRSCGDRNALPGLPLAGGRVQDTSSYWLPTDTFCDPRSNS